MAGSVSGSEVSEGPVLSLINKKLRALKKKYNRILQTEESRAQGKPLNKEQEDVLKSKPAVAALIEEYEKLRQPLAAALLEELSRSSSPPPPLAKEQGEEEEASSKGGVFGLEDLLGLLYFGCLFDVKPQSEFTATMLLRIHERQCCLTYDYVDEATTDDILGEQDFDMIAALGGLITSRPVYSGVSHKNALEGCIQHARLWLEKSDQPIYPESSVTYKGLRGKVNRIMSSNYFTTTPEMKATEDVAAAMGKYNNVICAVQAAEITLATPQQDSLQIDGGIDHYDNKEEEELIQAEASLDNSAPLDETQKDEASTQVIPPGDRNSIGQQDEDRVEADVEGSNHKDMEQKGQYQHGYHRGVYQNQRGGGRGGIGGGGRRGYSNGRGGRGGRVGGGNGYQNGRSLQQYYDAGYYPRNYYNGRGRGSSGNSAAYGNYNHGAPGAAASTSPHGSRVAVGAST